jgi:hypothetical protein
MEKPKKNLRENEITSLVTTTCFRLENRFGIEPTPSKNASALASSDELSSFKVQV